MKKTIAILLVLCLCVGLCACGGNSEPQEEKADEAVEKEYQQAISVLSTDPESARAFFLENTDYKESAEYLKKIKLVPSVKKAEEASTTYTYRHGLLIQEETTHSNGKIDIVDYTYDSNGDLLKVWSYTSGIMAKTDYDEHGYPVAKFTQRPTISNLRWSYENTYYPSGKIKSIREIHQETDSSGNWKDVYICNTVYEENGNYETIYEMSITGSESQTVKCDEYGNEIYVESSGRYPSVFTYEYEYDSNGNVLFKRNVNSNTYVGYEYNEEGLLVYTYMCGEDNARYLEERYEYIYVYQE